MVPNNKTFQEELKLIWEGELSTNLTRCYVFFILHVNECSACTEILFCICVRLLNVSQMRKAFIVLELSLNNGIMVLLFIY